MIIVFVVLDERPEALLESLNISVMIYLCLLAWVLSINLLTLVARVLSVYFIT